MDPSYNNGNGSGAGGQPNNFGSASGGASVGSSTGVSGGGIFSRAEDGGTANIPGAKPGVIASGTDVDGKPGVIASGPEAAEATALEIASNTSPGLSLGSKHLFKKPRASVPNRNVIMSVGDTASTTSNSRGPKKGVIISGILVVVLLIVGLIVGVMMTQRGGNSGGGNSTTNLATFNRLINYITNGMESTTDVDKEYDVADDYYFLNGWDSEDQKKEIYDTTKELMDSFVSSYQDGENATLNNLVKNTKDQFDFINVMDFEEKIYNTRAIMEIIKNGDSNGKQNLIKHYGLSDLNNNSYANDFLQIYNEWIDALITEIKIYKDNNCISGIYINTECIETKNNEELKNAVAEATENADGLYSNVLDYYDLSGNFVNNVYYINTLLHGNVIMGEDDE